MPTRFLRWLAAIVAFTCVLLSAANLSSGARPSALSLALILKADRSDFKMSDTMNLETQLRNIGEQDVYIWEQDMCWNPARGLSMRITSMDGKDVRSPFLLDCVPPPPRRGDAYQFVKLPPGRTYGLSQSFKLSEMVNGPAEYDIFATFNSFLSSKWTAEFMENDPISKLPLWTMEQPTLTSNRIHIAVKP